MKKYLCNYVIFAFAFLLLQSSCAVKKPIQSQSLKVLTYNIHHANPPSKPDIIDLPAIAKVINESEAELIALQEVDVNTIRSGKGINQAEELGRLTNRYFFFVKGIDYQGGEYGIGILSKFPILHTDSLRLPMVEGIGGEPRVLAMVTVAPSKGKEITFACTHLDLKAENRGLQAQAIITKLSSLKIPVILCGDFNAKPDSEVIHAFDKHFKRSSIPNGFTIPQINPNREIDFVMFSPENKFKVYKHQVIEEPYASDHLPVFVELTY